MVSSATIHLYSVYALGRALTKEKLVATDLTATCARTVPTIVCPL